MKFLINISDTLEIDALKKKKKIEQSMKNVIYKNVKKKHGIINYATTKPHTKDKSKLS